MEKWKRVKVVPYLVDYACDVENCEGRLEFVKSNEDNPRLNLHRCPICGKEYVFTDTVYPKIETKTFSIKNNNFKEKTYDKNRYNNE